MKYQRLGFMQLIYAGDAGNLVSSNNNMDSRNYLFCDSAIYKLDIGIEFNNDCDINIWCHFNKRGDNHYITIYDCVTKDYVIRIKINNDDLLTLTREVCIMMRDCFYNHGTQLKQPDILLVNDYYTQIRSLTLNIANILFSSVEECDNYTTLHKSVK